MYNCIMTTFLQPYHHTHVTSAYDDDVLLKAYELQIGKCFLISPLLVSACLGRSRSLTIPEDPSILISQRTASAAHHGLLHSLMNDKSKFPKPVFLLFGIKPALTYELGPKSRKEYPQKWVIFIKNAEFNNVKRGDDFHHN